MSSDRGLVNRNADIGCLTMSGFPLSLDSILEDIGCTPSSMV